MLNRHKNWLVHKQTACGKDFSNPFMVDNLPKIVGFSTHLASLVKSWLVQDQTVLGKDYSNLLIADSLLKTIWFINAPCYGNEALASPKANELTIPEQTATGKGTSNPFMAGSLPKTTKPTYRLQRSIQLGTYSDPCNDEERNYRKRRLAELRIEIKGVINASGQWKYSFYTDKKFTTPKEDKDRVYWHSIESRRNLKMYKNDGVRIRARCDGKVHVFTMSQGIGPIDPNRRMEAGPSGSSGPTTRSKKKGRIQLQRELEVQISMSKAFRAKAKAEREIREDHVLQYFMLRDYVVELQSTNPNTIVKIAVERNTDLSLPTRVFQRIYVCLGALKLGFRACKRDLLGLDGAYMKGPFPGQVLVAVGLDSNNGIYPLAYALVEAETKSLWCWFLQYLGDDIDLHPNLNFTFISDRQKGIIPAIKTIYPTAKHRYCLRHIHENMKDFEKCMLELKTMNPKAHEWLNKILAEHWARSHFSGRAKSDLFLNNMCEVFNGKIVEGVIDKCTGPLTPTATRIMESIKKEAHLMKVQWNRANKYQVSGSLGDQCVVDVDQVLGEVYMSNNTFITQASCPGRPTKEEKKEVQHEDEPFVKDGNLSRKGRTVTCQSCRNTKHNTGTCKGQGRKAKTEAIGSASRQAQQTEPAVGQDGSGGSGAGVVIVLSVATGEGGVGVASQVSQTRNADGREMGDGVPTQSSTAGGANKVIDVIKDMVSQKNVCEEEVPLNNNIGKQIGDFVDMPSEVVEQGMDATVANEIDGAKGEQVPNHVVKKGNLEFLVCKEVANPGINELVDKGRPLKRKRVYVE
ncbi:heat stress transcription factor B-4-like protein [Tanacetum coccineum]